MADETMTETPAAIETPAVVPAEKKTRKPRQAKVAAKTKTADVSPATSEKPTRKTRAKRGSKQVATAKAEKVAVEPMKVATRTPRTKVAAAAPVAGVEYGDDIADLIKLEEENKQLRQELSDKLRAENADLRKRLGKA
jgi:hypothetical protein